MADGLSAGFYVARAADFLSGMQFFRDEPSNRHSAALLAIHSAIGFTDALRIALGESSLNSDDHQTAVKSLEALLDQRGRNLTSGLSRLSMLLRRKSLVAYADKRLSASDFESIFNSADFVATWAKGVATRLRLEGWSRNE